MKRVSPFNTNINQMVSMIDKGTIVFDNPYQRPSGQWKNVDESLLIHSVFAFFIPGATAIKEKRIINEKEVNVYSIADGKQRMTTLYKFKKDQLKLANIPPFVSDIDGEEYDISGMKYSELPEAAKNEFDSYVLNIYPVELEEGDDKDEISRELILRLNNGVKMSASHLALVAAKPETNAFVKDKIDNHKLFTTTAHFAEGSTIKSEPQMSVLQSLALVGNYECSSFGTADIKTLFINQTVSDKVFAEAIRAFDMISEALPEYTKFVTKVFIPVAVKLIVNNDFNDNLSDFLKYYVVNNSKNDQYRKHGTGGTTKKDSVMGRVNGLQKIYEEWLQKQ
ncbi:DUF262 domain-containing protein [Paenibacillus tianjinensis]|uniref:DUF262 domain-containing protein n=1 Tax=Paenibacillus tianjinensis TaxID=2810347 RepID=A0ABX7L6D8_9BACL|nr:DUF262 domain-containing protein [Paenibacillus tianjinensis]QSF43492.1 DUF262 domain-containing protein [Paenibacillus tianjinensis]